MEKALIKHIDENVVVDTNSTLIYIGTLKKVDERWIALTDVDVHDSNETATSKELYVMESRATGVKANRGLVYINMSFIVSFSPLEDVKHY
jgi:small nuclear ribonucleoprotein (snRNP)-like protein